MKNVQPVILAGGSGSRLWPLSRETYPKQLLQLTGGKSLLQNTLIRVARIPGSCPPLVVAGEEYGMVVQQQIDDLQMFADYTILLEPYDKDTGPAVVGAAEYVRRLHDENMVILTLPSDHFMEADEPFLAALAEAAEAAAKGRIVTFGIAPGWPDSGFGYIEAGAAGTIISFKEKPDPARAREYLDSGNYYWNSGILVFTEKTLRAEMNRHDRTMTEAMAEATEKGEQAGRFFTFAGPSMAVTEKISIDYVLMESVNCGTVSPLDIPWMDLGTWRSLREIMARDEDGNAIKGDVITRQTSNSLIIAEDRLVAAIGLEDTAVVETADALLVASMANIQSVKQVVEYLKKAKRDESRYQNTSLKPWGNTTILLADQRYRIQKMCLHPGTCLTPEKHYHRHEHWVVVSGTARVTIGQESSLLSENHSVSIPQGVVHRLENPGKVMLEIIEVQLGNYLGNDDVVSYEDEHGLAR